MKNKIIFLLMLLNVFNCLSQEVEIDNLPKANTFSLEVDRTVFTDKTMNLYSTSDFMSTLLIAKHNVSYKKMKQEIETNLNSDTNVSIKSKGELRLENQNLLFVRYTINQEGIEYNAISYYKKNDNTSILAIIVKYPKTQEDIFEPLAKKAILTAKEN